LPSLDFSGCEICIDRFQAVSYDLVINETIIDKLKIVSISIFSILYYLVKIGREGIYI
jgi:hypothetical protein